MTWNTISFKNIEPYSVTVFCTPQCSFYFWVWSVFLLSKAFPVLCLHIQPCFSGLEPRRTIHVYVWHHLHKWPWNHSALFGTLCDVCVFVCVSIGLCFVARLFEWLLLGTNMFCSAKVYLLKCVCYLCIKHAMTT